jgi:capsular polysaccharide transport system permease protein
VPYPVFALSGIGPFILYRTTANLIMDGVSANRGLFAYKQITAMDTFIARTLMQLSISSAAYICLMIIFAWHGFDMSVARPLEWIANLLLGLLFSFGLGVLLAIFADAFPDTKAFIRMSFTPLYLLSGVIFPVAALPQAWLPYILWNPYLHIIDLIREDVFPTHQIAQGVSAEYACGASIVVCSVALGLYRIRRFKLLAIKG